MGFVNVADTAESFLKSSLTAQFRPNASWRNTINSPPCTRCRANFRPRNDVRLSCNVVPRGTTRTDGVPRELCATDSLLELPDETAFDAADFVGVSRESSPLLFAVGMGAACWIESTARTCAASGFLGVEMSKYGVFKETPNHPTSIRIVRQMISTKLTTAPRNSLLRANSPMVFHVLNYAMPPGGEENVVTMD
ncbi:hypothetical protein SAMN04487926_12253 [Paraburkholderia steynii]|uniref:Uncharacterized protein n=1 Tax=Paraburkholderia steynii TaxID=1245441 RepID=A0A7Z7BDC7_9BURK|nr:hypothetical protein SAMN04487926_12253 [Paraburkholderia steynii]